MKWSFDKPTKPGYYWRRMLNCYPYSEQPAHFIKVEKEDGDLIVYKQEGSEWEWDDPITEYSGLFEYAGPITPP